MDKRIIILTALVLGLVSPAMAAGLDPNLVGWWKLDGDALDASGNGRHGTLMGDAHFIDGVYDKALACDGNGDYVNIDGYKGINAVDGVQQPFTVANWFRTTVATGDREMVTWGTNTAPQRLTWRVHEGRLRTEHGSGNLRGNTYVNDGEWHHGALVVSRGAGLRVPATLLYVDGVQDTVFSGSDNKFVLTAGVDVRIGMGGPTGGRYWLGDLDDVRIYNRTLTAEEIAALAKRPKSYAGDPADGSLVEAASALLQWKPGGFAVQHAVYFGMSPDLGAADLAATQTDRSFLATNLAQEKTYYWRVDDVAADGTVHMGDVWSFWVPPQRAYDPQPADGLVNVAPDTKLAWTGGWSPLMHTVYLGTDKDQVTTATAGLPQMETTYDPGPLAAGTTYYWRVDEFYAGQWVPSPVWSFSTSIPVNVAQATLDYDNTIDPFVSQVTWNVAQDWTVAGFVDLSLEFSGNPPRFVLGADGVITLSGAGTDIWGTADQFRGAFKGLTGDGSMVARVVSNGTGSNRWAKGGVMIRQSLDAGSVHGFMPITGGDGNGHSFQRRLAADGVSTSDNGVVPVAPPYWVKIERVGTVLSAYISADGVTWDPVGTPQTIPMVDPVYIGLAVTSHAAGELRAYEFDNVSSTGNVTGNWQVVDLGVAQGGNDPGSVYVAVQDAAGASALVRHANPAATNLMGWTQWQIPLADLAAAGVNLAAVTKVTVGVGDGQPGGTGTVLLRNVQVVMPEPPVVTVAPASSMETTGNDGMILSINGVAAADLILGVTSTDFEKFADHPAPHADDLDLKNYASLDDSKFIITTFAAPVRTIFVVERGANDLGFLQPLDAAGNPVGGLQAFAKTDWFKPGVKVAGQDAGVIVITSKVPISGIMFLPPAGAPMGLDPASISAVRAQ